MKNLIILASLLFCLNISIKAQSCDDIMQYVQSSSYGQTYSSYTSDAISKVTFYTVTIDYQYSYFAVVCFKSTSIYGCQEYIYQVGSNTKYNYSTAYLSSAGRAFWDYIEPYSGNLGCGPSL